MSESYKLPNEQDEMIFYIAPKIGMSKDHLNLKTILYSKWVLEKVIKAYEILPNQSIGFCTDIKTAEFLIADLIEGYQNYWGFNITLVEDDIDFENPCQPMLRFPGAL